MSFSHRDWGRLGPAARAIVLLFVVVGARMSWAVNPNRALSQYVHDRWGVDRGFPNETVTAIAQTNDGYLWIGTDKSLIRFDGLSFSRFQQASPVAVPISGVQSLMSDSKGNLWVLLPNTQLLRYHDAIFEKVRGVAENGVTAIGTGPHHTILISSLAMGMLIYNGTDFVSTSSADAVAILRAFHDRESNPLWSSKAWSTGLKPHHLAGPAADVISVASADDGGIWLGTEDGELLLLKDRQIKLAGNTGGGKITSILPVGKAEVWVGSSRGLLHRDGNHMTSAGVPPSLHHREILCLMKDRDGNIWVATKQALTRINSAGNQAQLSTMPADFGPVKALFEDREGNLWVGGASRLERLTDSLFATFLLDRSHSQSPGPVYADAEERTWVAGIDGGLYWLKGEEQGLVTAAGLSHDIVYSIAGGEGNEVWLGRQRGGLTRLRYERGTPSAKTYTRADGLAQNSVYAVYRSRNGTIWSGTLSGGVSALHDGRFTTYTMSDGLPSNTISSIAEGEDGSMWFGTPGGLSHMNQGNWRTYSVRDGLRTPDVNCLLMDGTGTLWIGTAKGLESLRNGEIQIAADPPDPLQEPIFGIAQDRNRKLWIATANHILQVSPRGPGATLNPEDIREYTFADGLQGKEGVKRFRSLIADEKQRVWISTNHGLSVVDLPSGADQSPPALVHIVEFSADGAPIHLSESLRVPPARASITFRFAGLSLKKPERVHYRYRLDGFDRVWSESTTTREATYGNLPPGNYRFHVIACNSDGIWNSREAALGVYVEPSLVQTWWFRTLLLVSAALGAVVVYRYRVHQLTQLLNVRFEERLSERTRIAQDLHDTLLQSFQGLILRFQAANQILPADPAEAKQTLEGALDRADEALREGRKAIQGIRFDSYADGDLEPALNALLHKLTADFYFALGTTPATSLRVEGDPQKVETWVCEEICRVAREALRNAFMHAHAQHIDVVIEFARNLLRVSVRDDGIGMAAAVLKAGVREGHWGLVGMREHAAGLGARIHFRSSPGAGTEVQVTIPAFTAFGGRALWFARRRSHGNRS